MFKRWKWSTELAAGTGWMKTVNACFETVSSQSSKEFWEGEPRIRATDVRFIFLSLLKASWILL